MCFFLTIASPLTLSEIRSMLPSGLTADLAPSAERARLTRLHPSARTVAQLLVGSCSCDLVRPRQESSLDDERDHRRRYQRRGLPRSQIIRELERHRRGPVPRPEPAEGWRPALVAFVAEHARNAGPTLYLLEFLPHDHSSSSATAPERRSVAEVRGAIDSWLREGEPVVVS